MKNKKPDFELDDTVDAGIETIRTSLVIDNPSYFMDDDRLRAYIMLSGLFESGMSVSSICSALDVDRTDLTSASRSKKSNDLGMKRIAEFLRASLMQEQGKEPLSRSDISKMCDDCFGKGFLYPEEKILLESIPDASNLSAIFKAAANTLAYLRS